MGKELVGIREFFITGEPEYEASFRNGMPDGWQYRWDEPGKLLSCEPHEGGVPHGNAYQWASDGTLIGTYSMERGTGIDLWWEEIDGSITLSEVYYMVDGLRHGFEWWLYRDGTPSIEKHWIMDELHGIEREWNYDGGLRRGYPRYYVHDVRVTKRQYLAACRKDDTLPPFHIEDNARIREYPPEVTPYLRPRDTSSNIP